MIHRFCPSNIEFGFNFFKIKHGTAFGLNVDPCTSI